MRCLHISPHIGGGVGAVLLNWFRVESQTEYHHSLICLETISSQQRQQISPYLSSIFDNAHSDFEQIAAQISNADIVVLHWWHHPLLADLMIRYKFPACRLVLWSHVSGLHGTSCFTPSLLDYPDTFIFTTPISRKIHSEQISEVRLKEIPTIWSVAKMPELNQAALSKRKYCRMLYVGTLDEAKLSQDTTILVRKILQLTDNVDFTFIGDRNTRLESQFSHYERQRINFLGYVDQASSIMAEYDVFFYPLSRHHYGTCDQVIGEAMTLGLPVLAYDNPMERSIVIDQKCGLLAHDINSFVGNAMKLIERPRLRTQMAKYAVKQGRSLYNSLTMLERWHWQFKHLMTQPKSVKEWTLQTIRHIKPSELSGLDTFIECIGKQFSALRRLNIDDDLWLYMRSKPEWMSLTKGTLFHYQRFFREDNSLITAINILENIQMKNDPINEFIAQSKQRIASYAENSALQSTYKAFLDELVKAQYAYNFYWMGVPVIQAPQDLQALQEIIWRVKPDLIIETGVAWGGSIVFSASMLAMLEGCSQIKNARVIGIDIDIRPHNRQRIENHPMANKITLVEGSSVDPGVIEFVSKMAAGRRVMVCLDSNHTHEHVLQELRAYGPLVSKDSYCMVGDTGIEDISSDAMFDRPWSKGNNPKTAVWQYLSENDSFEIDQEFDQKLLLTSAPNGYLRKVK